MRWKSYGYNKISSGFDENTTLREDAKETLESAMADFENISNMPIFAFLFRVRNQMFGILSSRDNWSKNIMQPYR
jgi:hypothetical protein